MADSSSSPSRHRHAQPPSPRDRRRRAILIAVAVAVGVGVAITALLVLSSDRSSGAAADQTVALTTTTTPPASPPAPPPVPTAVETASTPEVPGEFAAAMEQIGIPLDPHAGWAVAQGICVRLGQPGYDETRMSEGVERLFPSISHEQAHEFVAMVTESVCHR